MRAQLEKRAEVAEKKGSEWQHSSLEARKVIEKREKVCKNLFHSKQPHLPCFRVALLHE